MATVVLSSMINWTLCIINCTLTLAKRLLCYLKVSSNVPRNRPVHVYLEHLSVLITEEPIWKDQCVSQAAVENGIALFKVKY